MGYNPNVPQPNDFVSQSQKDILQNYQEIASQFMQDHVMIDQEDMNRGKHKKVTYNEQGSDPTTIADEIALYTKDVSGQPEYFVAPESAGTVYRISKSGDLQPGLKVEASVTWDLQGNIIEEDAPTEEDPDRKRPLQFNVTSVVPNEALINGVNLADNWTVNFTNAISTTDYYWVLGWNLGPTIPSLFQTRPVVFHPTNNAAYASSVTANSISITGYQLNDNVTPKRSLGRGWRLNLIVYTRS